MLLQKRPPLTARNHRTILLFLSRPLEIAGLSLALVLISASDAWAYIDPGAGSYLFQLMIAGGLASLYTVRRYWQSLKTMLSKSGRSGADDPPTRSDGVD